MTDSEFQRIKDEARAEGRREVIEQCEKVIELHGSYSVADFIRTLAKAAAEAKRSDCGAGANAGKPQAVAEPANASELLQPPTDPLDQPVTLRGLREITREYEAQADNAGVDTFSPDILVMVIHRFAREMVGGT